MTADNKDCLAEAGKTGAITGGFGLVVSAMQNTVQKHGEGAKGVFTRTGGTIALFAAMGGVFSLGECVAKDIRGEDDAVNAAIGGCAAGLVAGIKSTRSAHSIGKMCLACAGIGGTMFAYEYSGGLKGSLAGKSNEEKKEYRESFFKKSEQA
ncbi:hypothetical protein EC973_002910 [Apophysomyces ossiformis]|uniref:Complex I-B14.7 n=1 Tax=Apophysomyces ossiformis TaxID=679940 RepID=A0A8H7BIF9_9FUNG|nr:hypothetical protein EC973_002910 [Apophysomyces ossiformis]